MFIHGFLSWSLMATLLPSYAEMAPFMPEVVVIATIAAVLLIPIFSPKRNGVAVAVCSGVGLLAAIAMLMRMQHGVEIGSAFGGMLVMDSFAWMLKLILLMFTLFVVILWGVATRESFTEAKGGRPGDAPEFFTLLLTATVGMMLMCSTSNLLMMFLAIEMASLPSYVLAGFRKTHKLGAEAALKYVLFGAVAAAIMLYGMSILYGYYGTLDMSKIAAMMRSGDAASVISLAHPSAIVTIGLPMLAILLGICFKIAAVPMHFWCPDVFEGANIDVTTYLSVASKAAGIGLLVRVITLMSGTGGAPAANLTWLAVTVTMIGALTTFWGNLGALKQNNIKRLLAFSSIAHAGYVMLAAATLMVPEINPERLRIGQTVLFYLIGYMFLNAGAFAAAAGIAQKIGSEDIRDYAGLGRRSPMLAACMLVFVLSLTGIPLTVGFGVKLKLFLVLFETPHWLGYFALAVLAINTAIGAFYYFRILKAMYLTESVAEPVAGWLPTTALAAAMVIPNIGLFIAYGWMDEQASSFAHVAGILSK
jgi:NADH-quinone oxidoreductase subunit N